MAKDWLYWVGGGGGGGGNSRSSTKRGRPPPGEMKEGAASASAGCMCAVFHLFHLHHFQFPSTQRNHSNTHPNTYPFLQEEASTTRGVEAPRNSLELEKTAAMKLEENLNFPVGIQMKTSSARIDDICSECSSCNSPGTKTPSVVARLMGLDLLPQCTSPSISSNPHIKSHRSFFDYDIAAGARSLPETPRISSSRRSDVERHRLSLQIVNKENIINEELADDDDDRRGRFNKQGKNRSPKQIVKHARRSVGVDITNTINRNRNTEQYRRDENLVLLKPAAKKNIKILSKHDNQISPDSKQSNVVRFLDHNKIKPSPNTVTKSSRISPSYDNHQNPLMQERHQQQQKHSKKVGNGGKCSSPRLKKLPRRAADAEDVGEFVRSRVTNKLNLMENKSNRTPLSCHNILNINGPTLRQLNKGKGPKGPSPPPTKLPQKQSQVSDALSSKSSTQLSSRPSQSYNQLQLQHDKILAPCSTNGGATALHVGDPPEHRYYIQIILKHAGIINQVNPLTKWHTPSHLIDPGIFHHLERKAAAGGCNTVLSHQCNRKLIFQLVDELLAETLTPHFSLSRRILSPVGDGGCFPMVEELCKRIDSFPAAKCVVLEDIDSLIDKDLCKLQSNGYLGEEADMVCEIEGEIVEWLVREAVAVMGGDAAE